MAVIATGRYNRGLQKAFGIKGEVVTPDLDSALQAGIDVAAVVDQTDLRLLFGWKSYFQYQQVAGDATHPAMWQIGIPADKGAVAVIERLEVLITAAVVPQILSIRDTSGQSPLGQLGKGQLRDIRGQGIRASSVVNITGSGTVALVGTEIARVPAEQGALVALTTKFLVVKGPRDEYVLTPTDLITLTSALNNDTIQVYSWWRERALDPSELTG